MINFPCEDYQQQSYEQGESFTIQLEPAIDFIGIES